MGGLEQRNQAGTTNVCWKRRPGTSSTSGAAPPIGIHTEAAFRFSRGVHPSQALLGAKRAAELLRRLAGGTVWPGYHRRLPAPPATIAIDLDPGYVRKLSGLDLSGRGYRRTAAASGIHVESKGETPARDRARHRVDVEGPHDLVEESAACTATTASPLRGWPTRCRRSDGNVKLEREEQVRDLLVRVGLAGNLELPADLGRA
jgi:phenylalanyl-tRNA synthetase beta chain